MSNHDVTAVVEFAVPFATIIVVLRRAADAGESVTFTAEQAKVLVEAFKLLSREPDESETE